MRNLEIPGFVPKLVKSGQTTATTYHFRPAERGFGWALCTVNDGTGELLITSDWGNWSHRWSADPNHLGHPTLTHFIGERAGCDYLASKLSKREEREVFDAVETVKHMQRVLCERRLEQGRSVIEWFCDEDPEDRIDVGGDWPEKWCGIAETREVYVSGRRERWPLTRAIARSIFDKLDELRHELHLESFVEEYQRIEGHEWITDDPWYDDLRHRPDTSYLVLLHGILPALIEACAAEVQRRAEVEATVARVAPAPGVQ